MNQLIWPRPWWVNLLILVPILTFWFYRRNQPSLGSAQLLTSGLFAIAFAFIEASVVIYLRAVTGFLAGSAISEIATLSSSFYHEARIVDNFPPSLLKVELFRETATILVLGCVSSLTVSRRRERWLVFLWLFGIWDISYYLFLRLTVGWPASLMTSDVLFLIPSPWVSQVWFPLLVSTATLLSILLVNKHAPSRRRTTSTSPLE